MKAACILFMLAPVLVGCGAPRPIRSVTEATYLDDRLSCAHLQGELSANAARLREVGFEESRRPGENLSRQLQHGAFFGTLLRDDGRSNQLEAQTLVRRNERLRLLAAQRGCPI